MRARITFSKTGALRYIGHLDLHAIWERAARRANLPLAYSQGFHPQPKINIACALPLGFLSRAEVMDMRLQTDIDLNELPSRLEKVLPPGISILDICTVEEAEPALQTQVQAAEYEVTPLEPVDAARIQAGIEVLLAAEHLPRERRGKSYDLRPLVEDLRMLPPDDHGISKLFMRLSAREGATGRPEETLDVIGIPSRATRIERTRLIFQS